MDPTTWNLPFLLVWLIMYGIIICRAGATYALGRLARGGLAKSARIRACSRLEKYSRARSSGEPLRALPSSPRAS